MSLSVTEPILFYRSSSCFLAPIKKTFLGIPSPKVYFTPYAFLIYRKKKKKKKKKPVAEMKQFPESRNHEFWWWELNDFKI